MKVRQLSALFFLGVGTVFSGCEMSMSSTLADTEGCVQVIGRSPIPSGPATVTATFVAPTCAEYTPGSSTSFASNCNRYVERNVQVTEHVLLPPGGFVCSAFEGIGASVPVVNIREFKSLSIEFADGSKLNGRMKGFSEGSLGKMRVLFLFDFNDPSPSTISRAMREKLREGLARILRFVPSDDAASEVVRDSSAQSGS